MNHISDMTTTPPHFPTCSHAPSPLPFPSLILTIYNPFSKGSNTGFVQKAYVRVLHISVLMEEIFMQKFPESHPFIDHLQDNFGQLCVILSHDINELICIAVS